MINITFELQIYYLEKMN